MGNNIGRGRFKGLVECAKILMDLEWMEHYESFASEKASGGEREREKQRKKIQNIRFILECWNKERLGAVFYKIFIFLFLLPLIVPFSEFTFVFSQYPDQSEVNEILAKTRKIKG